MHQCAPCVLRPQIDPLTDGARQDGAGDVGGVPLGPGPLSHTIPRKSLLLKVPLVTGAFTLEVPALVEDKWVAGPGQGQTRGGWPGTSLDLDDAVSPLGTVVHALLTWTCRQGHACLIILPSDKPSTRGEALALEALLVELLRDPGRAAHRWGQEWGDLSAGRATRQGLQECEGTGEGLRASGSSDSGARPGAGLGGPTGSGTVQRPLPPPPAPRPAAGRAAAWRAHALQSLCSEAIAAIHESAYGVKLGPRRLAQV